MEASKKSNIIIPWTPKKVPPILSSQSPTPSPQKADPNTQSTTPQPSAISSTNNPTLNITSNGSTSKPSMKMLKGCEALFSGILRLISCLLNWWAVVLRISRTFLDVSLWKDQLGTYCFASWGLVHLFEEDTEIEKVKKRRYFLHNFLILQFFIYQSIQTPKRQLKVPRIQAITERYQPIIRIQRQLHVFQRNGYLQSRRWIRFLESVEYLQKKSRRIV